MSKLYFIPTPVGNLEDMTFRAVRILKEVDLILAEDTRVTSKLLQHFEIKNQLWSYHQHNEHKVTGKIIEELQAGWCAAGVPGRVLPCAGKLIPSLGNSSRQKAIAG